MYRTIGNDLKRRPRMARLKIFPDGDVPDHIMANISDQIPRLRTLPKTIDDYSQEEIQKFPKLFDYPKDYVLK